MVLHTGREAVDRGQRSSLPPRDGRPWHRAKLRPGLESQA